MTRCEVPISELVQERFVTGAAVAQTLSDENQQNRVAWQDVVDCLLEWMVHPLNLEEDDIKTPSQSAIITACRIAVAMRDHERPAPLRVVPNGDGGIVFERGDRGFFESIEVDEDGLAEYVRYVASRLDCRAHLEVTA